MAVNAAELIVLTKAIGAADAKLALEAVGAAIVATGVTAVKMAGDFQQSINQLVTSAGESVRNIKPVSAGILQMSVDTATSTKELVAGMFNIESSGVHGTQALLELKAAAEGARAENASLAAVTDVLSTALHNYHLPVTQSVDVMNSLIKTTATGKMHMDDLTAAFKNVLSIASIAKVPLTDIEAALATMSLSSDKGASAGTHLSQMLTSLLSPSGKATSALKSVGLTTQQISDDMKKSLPDTVKMITEAVGEKFPAGTAKYIATLSAIVGGNKQMKAILELSGQSLKTFTDDAKQLAPTMTANSTAVDNWSIIQSSFNFKLDAAKNAVDGLFIKLGTALLPVLGQMLTAVSPLITSFGDWLTASDGLTQSIQNGLQFYNQWEGVINGTAEAIALFFVPALISSGVEAIASAAAIATKFVVSIITTGVEGYTAAYKLVAFTASVIASGVEGLIAGGKIAFGFVSGIVSTALESGITAAVMDTTLIPSLIAVGAAAWAATGPFVLVGAAIAALAVGIAIATPVISNMQKAVQDSGKKTTEVVQGQTVQIEASTGRIVTSFDHMKDNVIAALTTMQKNTIIQGSKASTGLENLFSTMLSQVGGDFSQMSDDAYNYLSNVESYVTQAQAKILSAQIGRGATNILNKNFGGYAEGTNYSSAGYHWVGERGPELLQLPMGSRVIPHHEIYSANSGGGSSNSSSSNNNRPIQVNLQIDSRTFARLILPALTDQIRNGVGIIGM